MGTPEYMAPEMLRGDGAGQTTDLYALGIVAYELLAGRTPFPGANTAAIMYAHVHIPPPPLHSIRSELPPAVEGVISRQLAKRPEARYGFAREFVAALREAANSHAHPDTGPAYLDSCPADANRRRGAARPGVAGRRERSRG